MKRFLKKGLVLLWAAALALSCATAALASGVIDVDSPASLTLQYDRGGAAFSVWRVGDVSPDADFTLTGDFAGYPVPVEGNSGWDWLNVARTLAGYAAADGIAPTAEGVTDEDGRLSFPGLSTGLYLVVGQPSTEDGYVYTPTPFLICLPDLDEADEWIYDVTAVVKYERSAYERRTMGVLKLWEGGDAERPEAVTVELLCDGALYDSVTLSAENNWRYVWEGLEPGHLWLLVERDVPENYMASVSAAGDWFTVTNTYTGSPEPEPPDPGPGGSGEGKLPQTGQLWWPVPLLAGAGLVLFAAGWYVSRRRQDEN
ncbi:MAG: Cna B-type domain-containing protein [Oscillospiraceae bacterium]